MNQYEKIQAGLDILRREAHGTQAHGWEKEKKYNEIIHRAEDHVRACGGDWFAIKPDFSREIADLLEL